MFIWLTIISCSQPKSSESTSPLTVIDRLKELEKEGNHYNNFYISDKQVEYLKEKIEEGNNDPETIKKLAVALLNDGQTKESLKLIEGFPNATSLQALEFKAIGNLRLGEQGNCIHHHNSESCIFPLKGKGIYKDKEGPTEAGKLYNEILSADPDNIMARWLLNLTQMAVGTYPESVDPNFVISEAQFTSHVSIGQFTDIATETSLNTRGLAGGSIMDDFNNDGWLDIVVSDYDLKGQLRFYANQGNGNFQDMTKSAGLIGQVGGLNIIQTDYNNDGWLDIFVLRGAWFRSMGKHPNSLLRNNGDNTFSDVTIEAGLYSEFPTQTAAWADVNLDGYLDLFIGNESTKDFPCKSELYLNNQDGSFSESAIASGLDINSFVKGAVWGDIQNDGLPDLYLSVLDDKNYLFINQGPNEKGIYQFLDKAEEAGVQDPHFSFPCWFWDYDNDGFEDIFVSGYDFRNQHIPLAKELMGMAFDSTYLPRLFKNNGDGTFSDKTKTTMLQKNTYAMGANFGDLNNDGFLDFYVGTGAPDLSYLFPNRMFLNQTGLRFEEITYSSRTGHLQKGHGVSIGDIDNDGDQDVFIVLGGAFTGDVFHNALLENPGQGSNWMSLKLEGTITNNAAVGTIVEVIIEEEGITRSVFRKVGSGGSFGASPFRLDLGLGKASLVKTLKIYWARDSQPQLFSNIDINKSYHLVQGGELKEINVLQ
ncbi:MAG: CRTAC1 family protein [Bacteroidota bacterium]